MLIQSTFSVKLELKVLSKAFIKIVYQKSTITTLGLLT